MGQKNSRQRWPLLHSVAKSGNCEIAKQILDAKSVDINDMDPHMVRFFVLQFLAL